MFDWYEDFKQYLQEQYKLAMMDYKLAADQDEQWKARMAMAKLERTASEVYGFQFADSLRDNV